MAVATGVFVSGTGVAVTGTGVEVGEFCVAAYMVCVTIACTVAAASLVPGWAGSSSGMAIKVTGKHAMIAKPITPNKIRIELVLIFILHLQVVLLMDGVFNMKVPRFALCYRTVTRNEINPLQSILIQYESSYDLYFSCRRIPDCLKWMSDEGKGVTSG